MQNTLGVNASATVGVDSPLLRAYQEKYLEAVLNADLGCVHISGDKYWVVDYVVDVLLNQEKFEELFSMVEFVTRGNADDRIREAIFEMLEDGYADEEDIAEYVEDRFNEIIYPQSIEEQML